MSYITLPASVYIAAALAITVALIARLAHDQEQ